MKRRDSERDDGSGDEVDDPAFAELLAAEHLPTDDLAEPGRMVFAYRTLSGTLVGYAGYELYGADGLLRSLVVAPEARGKGIGTAIVGRLCRRAFDAGARRAWLMTTTAAEFFEKIGFKPVERNSAPEVILATRQAKDLCPASAVVLSRMIRL